MSTSNNNSVIFIHPDGTTPSHYALARYVSDGPDGRLNWDMMDSAGVYLSHVEDALSPSSNAGAVVHAYGVKPQNSSYGLDEEGNPIVSVSAQQGLTEAGTTIMEEAIAAGKATAVINSGFIAEPGTGVFLADVPDRDDTQDITAEIVESGVDIIMGGGETDYLPVGTIGFFGEEGTRTDGRNLIEEAEDLGYTVIYTREQLRSLPADTEKVLGIFAASDTYNDTTEEANAAAGLDNYGQPGNENPPTVAEMLSAALPILSNDEDGFFVVLEEEGTDNFGNNNNGQGVVEAAIRADEAIGVAMDYIDTVRPNTLLITSADSNAGGMQAIDVDPGPTVGTTPVNPALPDTQVDVPLDGQTGRETEPFITGPDENGTEFPFGIAYAGLPDFGFGVVTKAHGLNAELVPSTHDNTAIYRLMYQTLFDVALPSPVDEPAIEPAPPATQDTGNVIFIHPDGTTPSHYALARLETVGPDGRINWDMMTDAGVYINSIKDQLSPSSNAGAVVHALGTKPVTASYGLDEYGQPVVSRSGLQGVTIMEEAIAAGKATAVINSGFIAEPGTGVFLADVESRRDTEAITAEIVESGVDIIMGGGETDYLPVGTIGFFGEEGTRTDGRNLIEEAEDLGYTVIYTREQLQSLPEGTTKILGIFAAEDTYNDTTEEINAEAGLDNYGQPGNENPPTVAEMLAVALPILNEDPDGFMVVLEEEGTDNFANNNNGRGTVEAAIRADDAIGVAMDFINATDPNTLLITSADSNASGVQPVDVPADAPIGNIPVNPTLPDRSDSILVPVDGTEGRNTNPFVAAPDANGTEFPFGIAYASLSDVPDGVVTKTYGLNAGDLPSSHENTYIYEIMYRTLFGQDSLPTLIEGTPESEVLLGGPDRDLILANEGDDTLAGSVNNDFLYGEVGNDLLRGDFNSRQADRSTAGGDDLLFGGLGDDRLYGQGGNDQLYGDDGNDRLFGNAGNDVLVGGEGFDTMTGGAGQDLFLLASQAGDDTITDFAIGEDFLVLTGDLTFENLTFTQMGRATVIGSSVETDLAILRGVRVENLLAAADSTFVPAL